jgi:rubrerythrin
MHKRIDKLTPHTFTKEMLRVLDVCHHIHKLAEEFYLYLANSHQGHRDIARMWGLLAIDKCNHSDTFKMAARIKGEGINEVAISMEKASNILNKMKSIPKNDAHTAPTVIEALGFTVKMEEHLSSVHFRQVAKFFNEADSILMTSSLRSSSSILHMMTEEYLNLTMLESDSF